MRRSEVRLLYPAPNLNRVRPSQAAQGFSCCGHGGEPPAVQVRFPADCRNQRKAMMRSTHAKPVLGVIGGSGVYDIDGLDGQALGASRVTVRRAFRRIAVRRTGRPAAGVSAAARTRPSDSALGDQLPRQHRCAQARGRDRRDFGQRRGLAARTPASGHVRHRRPVHRPHLRAHQELLRYRPGRPRVDGASGLQSPGRPPGERRTRCRHRRGARRHLSGHGRPAVLQPRRIRAVSQPGTAM